MHQDLLVGLGSILILGISAQWIAWRTRTPSILLLLLFGFLAGPVTGLLRPDAIFGDLLFPVVSISVAIILFEGGLSLRLSELEEIGGVVRNLVLIGVPVTMVLIGLAAWQILQMDISLAMLLGAILIVTGPTVIVPLLKSVRISERVSSMLRWEAIIVDPVGAIMAVLAFEAILAGGGHPTTGLTAMILIKSAVVGMGLGFLGTAFMIQMLKRFWIPDFLHNAFTLMMVVTVFFVSNVIQEESGLIAVTMAGIFLANQRTIVVKHILEFKESLQVLAISCLFIILAARLDPSYLGHLGWPHVAFILFLILLARPLPVLLSTVGSGLPWTERFYMALMAPRGIVAAAVGSVFALRLESMEFGDGEAFVSVIFLVIVVTVVFYGILARTFAKVLSVARAKPQGVLFAGAHSWARKMAGFLQSEGFPVLLVDTNENNVYEAHLALLPAVEGDILDEDMSADLNLNGIGRLLALTPNDDVNSVACHHFADTFERSEVYQLPFSRERRKDKKGMSKRVYGRFLFQKDVNHTAMNRLFQQHSELRKIALTKEYNYEAFQREFQGRAVVLFVITESGDLKVMTVENPPDLKPGRALIALVYPPPTS